MKKTFGDKSVETFRKLLSAGAERKKQRDVCTLVQEGQITGSILNFLLTLLW